MSFDEFQTMGGWVVKFLVYGILGAILIGFIVVFIKSLRANIRSRGVVGILIVVVKIAILVGIVLILYHFAKQYEWLDKIESMLP